MARTTGNGRKGLEVNFPKTIHNAQARDRGYNIIVVEDAVATFFSEHHRAALSALARVYAKVWSTDRVLSALNS